MPLPLYMAEFTLKVYQIRFAMSMGCLILINFRSIKIDTVFSVGIGFNHTPIIENAVSFFSVTETIINVKIV